MSSACFNSTHRFTIDTNCNFLLPALDLLPGRRCCCGTHVIVPHTHISMPEGYYKVASIDSPEAAALIAHHPELKTW